MVMILSTVVLVSVYAYVISSRLASGPRASIISPPLEFSIELNKPEYTLGEKMDMTFVMRNIGNKTITLSWPDYAIGGDGKAMFFDFYITDINDTIIYHWSLEAIMLPSVIEKTLTPGQQLTCICPWLQKTAYPEEAQAPMGAYDVRGLTRHFGMTIDGESTGISLETPMVTFEIK